MTSTELPALLKRFPKTRPPLPAAFQAIYQTHYKENREGGSTASSLAQRMEQWLHHAVASDLRGGGRSVATLELGAGTLNQLRFEASTGPYDVVEPFAELYAGSPHRHRVRDIFADITEVPADRRYDRITSVAALEHITNLSEVMAYSALLLAQDGVFRAAIPSEGGFLWRMGWTFTTGLEFRLRHGLDYGVLMAHEHVNTAAEIETLAGALFEDVTIRSYGIGRELSLYRFFAASRPRLDVAVAWLNAE